MDKEINNQQTSSENLDNSNINSSEDNGQILENSNGKQSFFTNAEKMSISNSIGQSIRILLLSLLEKSKEYLLVTAIYICWIMFFL